VGEEVVCQYVNNSFAIRAIALLASLVLCLNNSFSVLRTPETAKPHSQSGLSPYLLMWFCFSNKDTALAASSRAVSQTVDKTLLVSTPKAFFLFWVQKVCT